MSIALVPEGYQVLETKGGNAASVSVRFLTLECGAVNLQARLEN